MRKTHCDTIEAFYCYLYCWGLTSEWFLGIYWNFVKKKNFPYNFRKHTSIFVSGITIVQFIVCQIIEIFNILHLVCFSYYLLFSSLNYLYQESILKIYVENFHFDFSLSNFLGFLFHALCWITYILSLIYTVVDYRIFWRRNANFFSAARPENDATAAPPNVVGGKYVPPALKRSQMQAATAATTRRRGAPPDITSQAMFPTLGAANQDLK